MAFEMGVIYMLEESWWFLCLCLQAPPTMRWPLNAFGYFVFDFGKTMDMLSYSFKRKDCRMPQLEVCKTRMTSKK
ncbi:hypothetical protein KFK09_001232 [Dendrobium nobile]|uniref:Uncharacterized protein n=1 Tax=Dendrobium nobile TaxID=94219 RepID=A0A8T3C4D3_DENNO|nr:hypothetical protein KFK09_001232 [Dendrobium nobile]